MKIENSMVVFLCGARDYHAMDWYRSSLLLLKDKKVVLLTDLIGGEGFEKLITKNDIVHKLLILDRFLLPFQSSLGNKWRNFLKLLVIPIQVFLLKRFARKYPDSVFFAHSMYYLYLAALANVKYVGTPQGSEILIRLEDSRLYRKMALKGLTQAQAITVDSDAMQKRIKAFCNVNAHVIQNGIDIKSILKIKQQPVSENHNGETYLSVRGITPLYRIHRLIEARNSVYQHLPIALNFIYPFYEQNYRTSVFTRMLPVDHDFGRLSREEMYLMMLSSKIVFSIPSSDSSPRSVYESIFCGCIVVITYNKYVELLPQCMKGRIVIVDLEDNNWFIDAVSLAKNKLKTQFTPDDATFDLFDQERSFEKVSKLLFEQKKHGVNL